MARENSNVSRNLVKRSQGQMEWDIPDKEQHMEAIDIATGFKPRLEYIFTHSPTTAGGRRSSMTFGHAAVRYRYQPDDGGPEIDRVVSIGNPNNAGDFVEIFENPADYFFGYLNGRFGFFSTAVSTIRFSETSVSDEGIKAMHLYFEALAAANHVRMSAPRHQGRKVVELNTLGLLWSYLHQMIPMGRFQKGANCAQWVSEGLYLTGLLRKPHVFPKEIWIDLFEHHVLDAADKDAAAPGAKLVLFKQPECSRWRSTAENARGRFDRMSKIWANRGEYSEYCLADHKQCQSIASITQWLRNLVYWRIERFADVEVELDDTMLMNLTEERPRGVWCCRRRFRVIKEGVDEVSVRVARRSFDVRVTRKDEPSRPRCCRVWVTRWFHDTLFFLNLAVWIYFGSSPSLLGRVFLAYILMQINGMLE